MGKSQDLYKQAKKIIPGGTQLLSKRPEMFLPGFWPAYYKKAKGCEVWDLDGKKYIDTSYMGIGACVLGYADEDVNRAVIAAVKSGNMATLNCPEEFTLAKELCRLHPWAKMVRFARCGGEAMAIAVRLARAKTNKSCVLFCGYHGWHDWYLAANLADDKALDGHLIAGLNPKGVPRELTGTAIPFEYNDNSDFISLFQKHKNNLAAIILEPIRNYYPKNDFLKIIQRTANKNKIPLVVDEVSSGWRLCSGGAHLILGFKPDIAVFSKAMGNGFPIAAVIGKQEIMEEAQEIFVSSTYWTEKIGSVAALATIKKFQAKNVAKHLAEIGKRVQNGWQESAKRHKLKIKISGIYSLSHFDLLDDKPLVLKTLFTQLMLEKGFLATNAFYASYAHENVHVSKYLKAVDEVFKFTAQAIKSHKPIKYLKGKVCHAGFQRLN